MKQIQSRSLLYFLIVCAVITFRVDNILADQKKTVSPTPAEPTFTVDGMVFPAYPEGYKELEAQITELERQIELLIIGDRNKFSDKELKDKIQTAKNELDRLAKAWEVLENARKESWSGLSEDTQNILNAEIQENFKEITASPAKLLDNALFHVTIVFTVMVSFE